MSSVIGAPLQNANAGQALPGRRAFEIADEQYERVIAYLREELQRAAQGNAPTQERLL
ncbi:MAG TPA: hypothetical protein VF739_02095 [Ktedonobacterales bacterium]